MDLLASLVKISEPQVGSLLWIFPFTLAQKTSGESICSYQLQHTKQELKPKAWSYKVCYQVCSFWSSYTGWKTWPITGGTGSLL